MDIRVIGRIVCRVEQAIDFFRRQRRLIQQPCRLIERGRQIPGVVSLEYCSLPNGGQQRGALRRDNEDRAARTQQRRVDRKP